MTMIKHTKAAKLIHCNEKKLRLKNADGSWKFYAELHREQESPKCPIWFLEEQVLAFVSKKRGQFKAQSAISESQRMEAKGYIKTAHLLSQIF